MALSRCALALALLPSLASAQDAPAGEERGPFRTKIYGFVDARLEKSADVPVVGEDGRTEWESSPHEFDVANLHLMVQGTAYDRFRYFINLASPGSGSPADDEAAVVRNAWVEAPILGERLVFRVGKTYRRFGLYNEILDAVPTFIGIEPPELFDKDHLLVTRTTNAMAYGSVGLGVARVSYAAMTGNDERAGGEVPLGADLRVDVGSTLRVGSSFYTTNGDAVPTRAVGDGSPRGGVSSWMARDRYAVYGAYAQVRAGGFTGQAEYWRAHHDAERDPASVALLEGAGLNDAQTERFWDGEGNVRTEAVYDIRTFYARVGWSLTTPGARPWTLTPYLQYDFYENPESVREKDLGGDDEAGMADDGRFHKATAGLVVMPVETVALKVDGSSHVQRFNGPTVQYPEVRCSLSYLWELGGK